MANVPRGKPDQHTVAIAHFISTVSGLFAQVCSALDQHGLASSLIGRTTTPIYHVSEAPRARFLTGGGLFCYTMSIGRGA